jgi:hypothetical protein
MDTTEIRKRLDTLRWYFVKRGEKLEKALVDACRHVRPDVAQNTMVELLDLSRYRIVSDEVWQHIQADAELSVPVYTISTVFVKDAFLALANAPEEDMRFATGIEVGPRAYAITRLLQFKLSVRTIVAAEGDQASVNRVLIFLENAGHKLLFTFHIHPGRGPNATCPSSTDMDFARRLERGNYPVVHAVFCRQGYVRFFSYKRTFKVSLYGKGVEEVDENIYRLTSGDPVQG